jgi:hypothetical protein
MTLCCVLLIFNNPEINGFRVPVEGGGAVVAHQPQAAGVQGPGGRHRASHGNRPNVAFGRGVRRGVSKGVVDGRRLPGMRASAPETVIKPSQGWSPTGQRKVTIAKKNDPHFILTAYDTEHKSKKDKTF